MAYEKQAPDWAAAGIAPPDSKRQTGWEVEDRPPAAWLNWFMNSTSESVKELQEKAAETEWVQEQFEQIDIADASLTTKGLVQLSNSTSGTLETKAATEKAVSSAKQEAVSTAAMDAAVRANAAEANAKSYADELIKTGLYGITTGTANTYSVMVLPGPNTLVAGLKLTVKINAANTGASTLNVNGLGSKNIYRANGTSLAAGNLRSDGIYTVVYDGSAFILQGEGGEYGTAGASQVLSGYTIGTENGIISGTMVNRGSGATITPGKSSIILQDGYYGPTIIAGDSDLIAANIKSGVNIFGVDGALDPRLYAEGTYSSPSFQTYFTSPGGTTYTLPFVSLTGLNFTPKLIVCQHTGSPHITYIQGLVSEYYGTLGANTMIAKVFQYTSDYGATNVYNLYVNTPTTPTSFSIPVYTGSANYFWRAFG